MKRTFLALLLLGCSIAAHSNGKKATITESTATMETYGFSDPDPVADPSSKIYPYWRFSRYESQSVEKQWKTVTLENDFIRVTMFPEIGGKVWGAVDKTRGREFVYFNHVVKFRDIAMRGAWTSGGIEFNFGIIGHIPTTATPVDYRTAEKQDGSVSCFVSSYELLTRTYWTVEVNLPADKAYFTTSVTWSNASALEQPYYQWMNAAFKADGDLRICAPGNSYIGHAGEAHGYPLDEKGRDLSRYDDMTFGHDISIHIVGETGNYYGAYWAAEDFGFAHCCRQDEKLGRKFFSWSHAREGEIWKDLLTDSDGQYVEVQSGRMFNQPVEKSMLTPYKHHSFTPMGTDRWTEYWYPVEEIGVYDDASSIGAVTVNHLKDSVEVLFSPTAYGMKDLMVTDGNGIVHRSQMTTQPLSVNRTAFAYRGDSPLKIVIGDGELAYDENPESRRTERPLETPADFDWDSAYGHFVKGRQLLNIRSYREAGAQLDSSLAMDGNFVPALDKKALLELHLGDPGSAAVLLKRALSIDTYDGEANYLWGIANRQLDRPAVAKDGFSVAAYSTEYRSASYTMLAIMAMNEGNRAECGDFIRKALESRPDNMTAVQLQTAKLRKDGKTEDAAQALQSALGIWPLNPVLRYEQLLQGGITKDEYISQIRCEMPEQEMLEAALWYMDIGMDAEAADICSMTDYPIAGYLRGYLLSGRDTAAAEEAVRKADSASVYLVFPFRQQMRKVLQWAGTVSKSWKTSYYKALLDWSLLDTAGALEELERCDSSGYAPLLLARASLKSGEERLGDLLAAEKLENSWRTGDRIIEWYSVNGRWEEACSTAERYFSMYRDRYEIGLKYANALCESGQYEKCLSILGKFRVLPNEGARTGHAIYRKANLRLACRFLKEKKYSKAIKAVESSKIWDENLGVGKPYDELIDYTTENMILEAAKAGDWQKADSIDVRD